MKGPNPFAPWAQDKKGFVGRKPELNMYNSILKDMAGKRPVATLITGAPGAGKSALLRMFSQVAEKEMFFSVLVKAGNGERTDSLLSRMRAELMNYLEGKVAQGDISQRVAKRLYQEKNLLDAAKTIGRHAEGLILLIDDVSSLKDPDKMIGYVRRTLRKAGKIKLGFVLSSTEDQKGFEGVAMKLDPFDEHDVREMVETALGKGPPKMGEGCLSTVIKDSEGNPAVSRTMCYIMYERLGEKERIITRRHYIVNSSQIMSMLSRDFFDPLWQKLPGSERKVVRAFAEEGGPAHISDIARKLRMRHATTLALRLVERGQLIRVDRGIYKVFTRLYGKYAMQRG